MSKKEIVAYIGVVVFMITVLVSFFLWMIYDENQRGIAHQQALNNFINSHGGVVEVLNNTTEYQTGKYSTSRSIWYQCRFSDGYIIEVERYYGSPQTGRVPQIGEKWRLGTSQSGCHAYIRFIERSE